MTPEVRDRIEQIRHGNVPHGYIKAETAIIPETWKEVTLGDVINVFRGASPRPKGDPRYYGGSIPRLLIEDLTRDGKFAIPQIDFLTEEGAHKSRLLPKGSLVMSCSGTRVGIIGFLGVDACIHDGFFGFNGYKGIAPEYLYQYFQLFSQSLQSSATQGGVFNNLTTDIMKTMKCCFPLIDEQHKIVRILTAQDKVIELKEKLLAEKQRQKNYLMQQLLTGKKRLNGYQQPWKLCKLSEILKEGSKERVADTSHFRKMTVKLNFKGLEHTSSTREMADTRPFYIRRSGEIIIGKQNYFNGSIALVTEDFDGCICSNAIMSFSIHGANTNFVVSYLSQVDFLRKHEMLANGTGQKELSEKDFLNFTIMLPNIEEQNVIADTLTTADKEIDLLRRDLEQEKQKKKALMQLLLTGIVRVNA